MAKISHQKVAFPDFKLRMCLFLLCLIGIVSASDLNSLTTISVTSKCPLAFLTIKTLVTLAVVNEPRMGASLLRLHFHDCFVQGCDASVLLKDNATFMGEQSAFPNVNSLRGLEVIDNIKGKLESLCPGVVSCADILAVAARDSVVTLGGRGWDVQLGRRDSTNANLNEANSDLPGPFLDLDGLIAAFKKKGFTANEMVALSGAHTIGKARCLTYRSRIYNNESNIDSFYAKSLRANCPQIGGDNNLAPIDITTQNIFDNAYYRDLMSRKGLFHSDQQLFSNGSTDSKVKEYAMNPFLFKSDFANAMFKMSNLSPLTGTQGQIRKVCSKVR